MPPLPVGTGWAWGWAGAHRRRSSRERCRELREWLIHHRVLMWRAAVPGARRPSPEQGHEPPPGGQLACELPPGLVSPLPSISAGRPRRPCGPNSVCLPEAQEQSREAKRFQLPSPSLGRWNVCLAAARTCRCLLPALARHRQSQEGCSGPPGAARGRGSTSPLGRAVTAPAAATCHTRSRRGCVSRHAGVLPANPGPWSHRAWPACRPYDHSPQPSGQGRCERS